MEAHIEIIRDMLKNILHCPNAKKCRACNHSIEIALSSLETIQDRLNNTGDTANERNS